MKTTTMLDMRLSASEPSPSASEVLAATSLVLGLG